MALGGIFRPGMRGYFVPLIAGATLALSAFLPWVVVGPESIRGFPDVAALWILGLGALASVLALLSLITRRNSRHPLLVVGLCALGIAFLSYRIMPQTAGDRAQIIAQAFAIVENTSAGAPPIAGAGSGLYLALVSSAVLVAFGLTIVVKRAAQPYVVVEPDDDV
jgi:hypothetical protein